MSKPLSMNAPGWIMARKLRVAFVMFTYQCEMISRMDAQEILAGPVQPGNPDTVVDDSALLDDPDPLGALDKQRLPAEWN